MEQNWGDGRWLLDKFLCYRLDIEAKWMTRFWNVHLFRVHSFKVYACGNLFSLEIPPESPSSATFHPKGTVGPLIPSHSYFLAISSSYRHRRLALMASCLWRKHFNKASAAGPHTRSNKKSHHIKKGWREREKPLPEKLALRIQRYTGDVCTTAWKKDVYHLTIPRKYSQPAYFIPWNSSEILSI